MTEYAIYRTRLILEAIADYDDALSRGDRMSADYQRGKLAVLRGEDYRSFADYTTRVNPDGDQFIETNPFHRGVQYMEGCLLGENFG